MDYINIIYSKKINRLAVDFQFMVIVLGIYYVKHFCSEVIWKKLDFEKIDWLIKVQHLNSSAEQKYMKLELKRHWLDHKNEMDWQIFEYINVIEMSLSENCQP